MAAAAAATTTPRCPSSRRRGAGRRRGHQRGPSRRVAAGRIARGCVKHARTLVDMSQGPDMFEKMQSDGCRCDVFFDLICYVNGT
ncbi:hypothetical protein ZWY2020_005722 [Hordeum vulgare]|nr:hypothetical protein ZWY2020_005722 [Hordeum vulgare]